MIQKNKLFFGGIFYGLSVMIKWQPLIVLPFILIYLIKTPELELIRKKALNIKSFLLGFSILPIFTILYIGWQPILLSLARALNHKFLSGNALNLPWILGLLDTSQFYGSQEIKYLMQNQVHMYVLILCRVIFLLSWILLLKRYWFSLRTYEDLILSSVLGTIFYFSFNLGVHENHLFIAAILSLMGFWIIPNQRLTFFTIILMSELNLILFYGLTGKALASRNFIGVDLSIPLSMVFIFALIGISIDLVSSMSKKV
jgi:hypothetical protein